MKWFKVMTLTLLISGFSATIGFAELQAFVDTDKSYVRSGADYSSSTILELKKGDRVEVLETTTPLLVNPYNQTGYISNSQVTLYNINKSGDIVLSKNIKVNTTEGEKIIEKGTTLPVYDYTNEHYMIKWNGFYYFIHETTVETKLTGMIEKPVMLTAEVFGKSEIAEVGLNDLFNEMDSTLSEYQNQVKAEEAAMVASLTGSEKQETPKKEETKTTENVVIKENNAVATSKIATKSSSTGNINVEKYKSQPIIEKALEELGKPYVWGAVGPNSFDCSGFTYSVYQSMGIKIPRVSADQGNAGTSVEKSDLKAGDLIFFDTRSVNNPEDITDDPNSSSLVVEVESSDTRTAAKSTVKKFVPSKITHVGMYIGDGYFIHASSGEQKVVIQSLELTYYQDRYLWAKRYM